MTESSRKNRQGASGRDGGMSCNDGCSLNCQRIGNYMRFYEYACFNVCPVWVVWTVFFGIYEKLTWIWYEKVLRNETDEVIVNVKIANIVTMIIVMVSVYILAYLKKLSCVQLCRQFKCLPYIASGCINSVLTGI